MTNQLIDIHRPVTVCRASAGTGKTYTLAAYFVGLLLSGEDYRSILAVTFTNKATAEMRERIMTYLYGLSCGTEPAFLARARQFMVRDREASDEELSRRAAVCLRRMLLDFDNLRIQTIDSFLQTLLSGLAGVLRMNAGLKTETDIDHVLREAVDRLLTTDMTPSVRAILEDYMRIKLDEESHWDIRQGLCMMAKELYNESVQMLDASGHILFDAEAVERRRKAVEEQWRTDGDLQNLRTMLSRCDTGKYNRFTLAAYNRLCASVSDPSGLSAKDRFRGVSGKYCNADEMAEASALAEQIRRRYNTLRLTIRFSRDMQLMSSLQTLIQRSLAEANCALLARTASTLHNALREGDADFILEKAGIRYKHILIDEFQDTSRLQWSVINRLLLDVLAGAGNTLLIVGDIKQSIYRWRNGDWHIMDELSYPGTNEAFTSLTRNFRSREHVVNFNLSLFNHIISASADPLTTRIYSENFAPERLEAFYESDKKKGGFVRFRAFRKCSKELIVRDMFDAMEQLLRKGAQPAQMMVLVREKKEAAFITDIHALLKSREPGRYPCLAQAAIVSSDSFVLEASEAVRAVVAALRLVVKNDPVAAKYVELYTRNPGILAQIKDQVSSRTPLYEAVSEVVRLVLTDEEGQYKGTETAYINSLLDRTREYVSAYGSRLEDFLVYWDDTLHSKAVPVSATDAITILTVHASKGLQAQTLFVPFCNWTKEAGRHPQKIWCKVADIVGGNDYVPVPDGPEMADSDYSSEYEAEHQNMRIDNLNMLYVALTRAEDNLYISSDFSVTAKGELGACNHVGRYLLDFCELNGTILQSDLPATDDGAVYAEYKAGEPVVRKPENAKVEGTHAADKPFSFNGAETVCAELRANSSQVRFVQSEEGSMYTDYGEEAYRRVARMDEGVLCHEIFAHLSKADELDAVLDDFETRGEIASRKKREELKSLISSAWEGNEQMRNWFTAPWELHLEKTIYIDSRELRPDRVMINPQTKEAVVLDYKFGQWEDKYINQVSDYMKALTQMGYSPVSGYLWFARKPKGKQLVQIHG